MNKEIFNGFPKYIRITICAQIKKLLSTPYFGYDDREDIAQDMLCHYLYKFYEIPDVDEALVVHDLRPSLLFFVCGSASRGIFLAKQVFVYWSPSYKH